jgi:hypothetical protein
MGRRSGTVTWDSTLFWDRRYASGNHSGRGSQGVAGIAKARHVNKVVRQRGITSIIDWGVGDGEVMSHIQVDNLTYIGVDISATALDRLRRKFGRQRTFVLAEGIAGLHAEMAISLDVMYHLVGDDEYSTYLSRLFGSADRVVLIYSTDFDDEGRTSAPHIRRRHWTPDVEARFPEWSLAELGPWGASGDQRAAFFLYTRTGR